MKTIHLTEAENNLMQIIWEGEPIPSGELVKRAGELLEWKKSTTYTILKKLEEKGLVENQNAVVTGRMSRQEYENAQKKAVIHRFFSGSLPQFLSAFVREETLSEEEIAELEAIIREYKNSKA